VRYCAAPATSRPVRGGDVAPTPTRIRSRGGTHSRRRRSRPAAAAVKLESMCGIVGYVGTPSAARTGSAADVVPSGLRPLEYRGYDSVGIALVTPDGDLAQAKKAGKLTALLDEIGARPLPHATTGIGHTRWATHGGPT